MKRLLDETHVGEYTSKLAVNIISTILMVIIMIITFVSGVYYENVEINHCKTGEICTAVLKFDVIEYNSIEYLFTFGLKGTLGFLLLLMIISTIYIFINKILLINKVKCMKTKYLKISKLIELGFLAVIIVFMMYNKIGVQSGGDKSLLYIVTYISLMAMTLCDYFTVKKVSIYD